MSDTLEDFDDFFRAELPQLVGFLIQAGYGVEDSRDAATEAMFTAYQAWGEIHHPRAYVRTVAQRSAAHQYRRDRERTARSIRGGLVTPDQTDPFPRLDEMRDALSRTVALLEKVPGRQRLVLLWHVDGFTNAEIAQYLEMSPATVASHLRHAKKRVRRLLQAEQPLPIATAGEGGVHDDPS